jgi:hypothetical protein
MKVRGDDVDTDGTVESCWSSLRGRTANNAENASNPLNADYVNHELSDKENFKHEKK